MAKKIRRQVKGSFDEKKIKLPGEGTGQLVRKKGRFEAMGLDVKSIIIITIIGAGLLAMLIGTIHAGNRREERREQQEEWKTQCREECTTAERSPGEVRRCVERCLAGKEAAAE